MSVIGRETWTPQLIWFSCLILTLLLSSPAKGAPPAAGNSGGGVKDPWAGVYSSWALGIVIPDGARLEGGGKVSWSAVSNLTALVRLPNITEPDGITYVVLSAMGSDRTVFQVAAGIWPGSNHWSVFSWFIEGIDSQSPTYRWVANATGPLMLPSDLLSLSITSSPTSAWVYGVTDHNTSEPLQGSFPGASATAFGSGDQEVITLESYSRSSSTFYDMGNLTLESVFVDGARVPGSWYSYSGWDPNHNPLFIVGGSAAPLFISFVSNAEGGAVWSYSPEWTNTHADALTAPIAVGVAAIGLAGGLSLAFRRSPRNAKPD